jgi:hypothetical protein
LGGVPCGVQDRVREREERLFAPNQCRRVCNDWPLVAALLLVLSLMMAARNSALQPASRLVWRSQGTPPEARDLLAPVYVNRGFDTRDLREAKALLGELGSPQTPQ